MTGRSLSHASRSIGARKLLALLLATLLLSAWTVPLNVTVSNPPIGAAALRALLDKAHAAGTVRVILRVASDIESMTPRTTGDEAHARIKIAAAQDAVLRTLPDHARGTARMFKFIPFFAANVEPATLIALAQNPAIYSITEDAKFSLGLADSVPLIGGTTAWSAGYTGTGQVVAVLDTGVDRFHPFLSGKVIEEACYSTTNSSEGTESICPNGSSSQIGPGAGRACPSTISGCDHGTHVAGIAAGRGTDFSGVAKDANIMAVQVFSRFGTTLTAYDSDIIAGLERVYELHTKYAVAAVNLSLGGGLYKTQLACDTDVVNVPLKLAIDRLRQVGIATVAASGNEGYVDALSVPACLSSAISVGSTTKKDTVSNFSNSASFLDLLAPGDSITSSIPGTTFASMSGTSMAAPHVAGAVAVLRAQSPFATVDNIVHTLKTTGKPSYDPGNKLTKPRIQLDAAVAATGNQSPTATVKLDSNTFQTNDTVTATATKNDLDGNPVMLTFVWKQNNTVVQTTKTSTSLSDSLDLQVGGNGDKGDQISVEVTPNDGLNDGETAIATAAVTNTKPVVSSVTPSMQHVPVGTFITPISITATDVDGDTLTINMQYTVNGGVSAMGLPQGLTLDPVEAGTWTINGGISGNEGTYEITVTVKDGIASGSAPVTIIATQERYRVYLPFLQR